ncbi:hypothetical protein KFE98_14595 [bacterium SCSIO 12741]|nr:hypothetical protein KFE98_14595 [bacterium SCSIO 12741]
MTNHPKITLLSILLFAIVAPKFLWSQDLCPNQIELLHALNAPVVQVNLGLNDEGLRYSLQKQTDLSFCPGPVKLNGQFQLNNKAFSTLIVMGGKCDDSTGISNERAYSSHVLVRSKDVLINAHHQLLINGHLVHEDSVILFIQNLSLEFFWKYEYRLVAYSVQWENEVSQSFREQIVQDIIQGFLMAADSVSERLYQKSVCQLSSEEVKTLKKDFQFALVLDKPAPLPPPPRKRMPEIKD